MLWREFRKGDGVRGVLCASGISYLSGSLLPQMLLRQLLRHALLKQLLGGVEKEVVGSRRLRVSNYPPSLGEGT